VRFGKIVVRGSTDDEMRSGVVKGEKKNLADSVHSRIKNDIIDFRMMPGQRFSENEIAQRLGVSRTPIRQALYKLEQEGYIQVASKSGWSVRSFDFDYFENLYDLRVILELAAVRRVCETDPMPAFETLRQFWLVSQDERTGDGKAVAVQDELFHQSIVIAAGNAEMTRVHNQVSERIRIIRRLDFTQGERIKTTYGEHAQILRCILRRKTEQAVMLLRSHIETSKAEVRKITLHKLHSVRHAD
jgi:DNA-binding GntR family transcriptional regulator